MNENEVMNPHESGEQKADDSYDYISAINEMKKNSVSREQYEKIIQERNKLADAVINGSAAPSVEAKPTVDIAELRTKLFSPKACDKGMTDLDFMSNALKLRSAILEQEGKDIFLPAGKGIIVTTEDKEQAENAAQLFQSCVDYADGDPAVFKNELMRHIVDVDVNRSAKANSYYRR
jgi:hypothetical protein